MRRRAWLGWIGTLLYLPLLYALGWLTLQPLLAAGLLSGWRPDQVALLGTGLAFLLLLLTLPLRLGRVWGERQPWRTLGVAMGWGVSLRSLLRGLLKAVVLLIFVVGALLLSGQARWSGGLTAAEVLNAVLLILGVGFAEELVFRGWLWGELCQRLGGGVRADERAMVAQAVVFSLAHTRFNLGVAPMAGLLVGLLLLGLALGLQRRADGGSLWGAVGLHGGLVGGWFSLLAGPLQIESTVPLWLAGPGGADPNPIGGLLGWSGLAALLWVRRRYW
ncbi:CPBP family intramembrane metalloprotease [Synechococcus sp. CS-1329]|uniref:CPBP family intramembrane glutamic endopeptidase n=1 Tax=Synechococcus sp. CS-1329 TaxID=2847975 RepID=UPI00223AF1E0|nr:CPBP family intramembrane glutamic endopeptidase [Synechococcus sp. CS-1329]MCT0217530.1 CPBP family intramembrane metalloprotease [Synechococcus sp. CS-1329]